MGLRGIGAKPLAARRLPEGRQSWQNNRLSRAERVIAFCESLTVTSGPLAGENLEIRDWQREFIYAVYAVDAQGRRPVRTAVLSMGRKNGKTQLAAALALCHLCGPEAEPRGEVYACANDRFQASKIFNEMNAMIIKHPWLAQRCNVSRFTKEIEDLFNGSNYYTLTKEAKTKMGLSPTFIVYDELGQATDRDLYDAMDSAMGGRKEPLMMVISTQAASDAAPLSQLIDYGLKVLSGEITDKNFHLTLYTAPDDLPAWEMDTWKLANPALGDFRSLEDVQRLAGQAQRIPSQENSFRNLILNQRVAAEARFMDPSKWKLCDDAAIIPPGVQVYAGLDLGSTQDLSSLALAWQNPMDGIVNVKSYNWVPGDLKERANQDGAPYEVWARKGLVYAAGAATDPRAIALKIAECNIVNKIRGLAFDRWRMNEIKRELDAIGCAIPLVEHGMGFKDMTSAVDIVERLVATQKLHHGGNPVLTWCANNAIVLRDPAGGRKFDKSLKAYRSRVDALVAMAIAVNTMLVKDVKQAPVFDVEALIG